MPLQLSVTSTVFRSPMSGALVVTRCVGIPHADGILTTVKPTRKNASKIGHFLYKIHGHPIRCRPSAPASQRRLDLFAATRIGRGVF
jgi:hypothetical protein